LALYGLLLGVIIPSLLRKAAIVSFINCLPSLWL
jgi:hypothetical protein